MRPRGSPSLTACGSGFALNSTQGGTVHELNAARRKVILDLLTAETAKKSFFPLATELR